MFVYIVAKEDHSQPWKIGRTTDPDQRMKQLQAHSPAKLVYVKIVEAHQSLESSLHRQFAKYRSHGEWFELPEERATEALARLDGEAWVQIVRPQGKRPYGRHTTRKTKKMGKVTGGQGFRFDDMRLQIAALEEHRRLFP